MILRTREEYSQALLALGGAAQARDEACRALLAGLRADCREGGLACPLDDASAAFGLGEAGALVLAACAVRSESLLPPLDAPEALALYRALGGEGALPVLLRPRFQSLGTAYALGRAPELPACARWTPGSGPLFGGEELPGELLRFIDSRRPEDERAGVIALTGKPGSGRRFVLAYAAARRGCALLELACAAATADDAENAAVTALLYGALVCLEGYTPAARGLLDALARWMPLVLLTAREPTVGLGAQYDLLERAVPALTGPQREAALAALFSGAADAKTLRAATEGCGLSPGRMAAAAGRLRAETRVGRIGKDALLAALRAENAPAPGSGARLLETPFTLGDLTLPRPQEAQVARLIEFARSRDTVLRRWGFGARLPYGRGLSAVFYGAPGTGKTMAAGVVANELGMPLYRVDLSQLISKYIGETQKNIGRVFDDAQESGCVLFFDEADALFSRRAEATDAQDRYSNAEVAYLLERVERCDGIILLATNLMHNFDEAFRRRISFVIHLPLPDATLRLRIWEGVFPPEAPVRGLDRALLARELELSGAGIKSCAVHAAYLAAAEGGEIDMRRVLRAAKEEYDKQGKAFPVGPGLFLQGGMSA